jgi:NAD(P)-dependent dehydrogenase (short-subunit alcohol dehydrogenase family)
MGRTLRNATVVITGASSGIGRATARAFAGKGANVVLAARREQALQEAAEECRQSGVDALFQPTDVSDAEQIEALAAAAVDRFGRIDVWVNNAAVTMFAPLETAPLEDIRRVIETNLFGYLYGARAALRWFREQGAGVLVNNASMLARLAQPYLGPYVMTKHAIRGMDMTLRQELALDRDARGISVCTVMPATIDTPLFRQAANHTGREAKAMPPVYTAERVARTIVHVAQWPRKEVFVGPAGRMLAQQHKLAPGLTERILAVMTDKQQLFQDRPAASTRGNLYAPVGGWGKVDGGWHGRSRTALRRGASAGLAVAGLAWARAGQRNGG